MEKPEIHKQLMVNGQVINTFVETLAELLQFLGYVDSFIAVAVNETCIPKSLRQSCKLTGGDRIEILSPMAGG